MSIHGGLISSSGEMTSPPESHGAKEQPGAKHEASAAPTAAEPEASPVGDSTAYEQAAIRALKELDEGKAAYKKAQKALQDKGDKKATSLKRPAAAMAPTTGSEAHIVPKGSPCPRLGGMPSGLQG